MLPRISVITPSLNQGQFLEETILSVINQQYPNLQYLIMDGGSNDDSVDLIRKYQDHLYHWESEKDNGQADAINRGFRKADGEILCWLNSDDYYLPGTLLKVARHFMDKPRGILVGGCLKVDQVRAIQYYENPIEKATQCNIELVDFIQQPASFWDRKTYETAGELNSSLDYAFDWEWFIRASRAGIPFHYVNETYAAYRIHGTHKSGSGNEKRLHELHRIYRQYAGEQYADVFYKLCFNPRVRFWSYLFKDLGMDKIYPKDKFLYRLFFRSIPYPEFRQIWEI